MKSGEQRGFTYLTALFLVAVAAAAVSAGAEVWSTSRQREKEADLIWIGNQFVSAIGLYYQRSPGTVKQFPEKLEDLLEDRRQLSMQRYLRRIYRDPITGEYEWGLVRGADGRITGVHSLSQGLALSRNLDIQRPLTNVPRRYFEWRFVYVPPLSTLSR